MKEKKTMGKEKNNMNFFEIEAKGEPVERKE
jgi:hypothetical protein